MVPSKPSDDHKENQSGQPQDKKIGLNDVTALHTKARDAEAARKINLAIDYYTQAAELNDYQAMAQLGRIYYQNKKNYDPDKACGWFELALRTAKQEDKEISAFLGEIYITLGKPREAEKHLLIAVREPDSDLDSMDLLAELYFVTKHYDRAAKWYTKAYIKEQRPDIFLKLLDANYASGDAGKEMAKTLAKKNLGSKRKHPEVVDWLIQVYTAEGDSKKQKWWENYRSRGGPPPRLKTFKERL